jgi:beta-phosphoglucomutase-like phosphatase (HAD superfamily)
MEEKGIHPMMVGELARLDVRPGEAVLIDDTLVHVQAARRAGLHAIHLTTAEALERELDDLLSRL